MSIRVNVTCDHGGRCPETTTVEFDSLAETFGDIVASLRGAGWHVEATGVARETRCICPYHGSMSGVAEEP